MSHIVHHAIIITSCSHDKIKAAVRKAHALGCQVTAPLVAHVNGYYSTLVGPDGSGEGWGTSEDGNEQRNELVKWLRKQRNSEGGNILHWLEVMYGGDTHDATITRHEWKRRGKQEIKK